MVIPCWLLVLSSWCFPPTLARLNTRPSGLNSWGLTYLLYFATFSCLTIMLTRAEVEIFSFQKINIFSNHLWVIFFRQTVCRSPTQFLYLNRDHDSSLIGQPKEGFSSGWMRCGHIHPKYMWEFIFPVSFSLYEFSLILSRLGLLFQTSRSSGGALLTWNVAWLSNLQRGLWSSYLWNVSHFPIWHLMGFCIDIGYSFRRISIYWLQWSLLMPLLRSIWWNNPPLRSGTSVVLELGEMGQGYPSPTVTKAKIMLIRVTQMGSVMEVLVSLS